MLKEKTINLVKPIKKDGFVKIAKNEEYDITKIDKDIINEVISKRNRFNSLYGYEVITIDNLIAKISTINAVAINENEGTLWADFNVIIYSN